MKRVVITLCLGEANNKGADQPAHPRRLIRAFVNRLLERIIAQFATSESLFVRNPENWFSREEAQMHFLASQF